MATTRRTKAKKSTKGAKAVSQVRPTTLKEAVKWLNLPSSGDQKYDRVVAAIRDPLNSHRIVTIVVHE